MTATRPVATDFIDDARRQLLLYRLLLTHGLSPRFVPLSLIFVRRRCYWLRSGFLWSILILRSSRNLHRFFLSSRILLLPSFSAILSNSNCIPISIFFSFSSHGQIGRRRIEGDESEIWKIDIGNHDPSNNIRQPSTWSHHGRGESRRRWDSSKWNARTKS